MEGYRQFVLGDLQDRIDGARRNIERLKTELEHAEAFLDENIALLRDRTPLFEAFARSVVPAAEMPARGQVFVLPDPDPSTSGGWDFDMWHALGILCVVDNPAFGFCIRFIADVNGMYRSYGGDREFNAGDTLEYLGVGATYYKPGGPITLVREDFAGRFETVLRRALDFHGDLGLGPQDHDNRIIDMGNGRHTEVHDYDDEWRPISGRVVSVEPRCSAYWLLEPGLRTIEEIESRELEDRPDTVYPALREVFLPKESAIKAAAKKK